MQNASSHHAPHPIATDTRLEISAGSGIRKNPPPYFTPRSICGGIHTPMIPRETNCAIAPTDASATT